MLGKTAAAVAEGPLSDPARELANRARDLQVQELNARIRGDSKAVAEIVSNAVRYRPSDKPSVGKVASVKLKT